LKNIKVKTQKLLRKEKRFPQWGEPLYNPPKKQKKKTKDIKRQKQLRKKEPSSVGEPLYNHDYRGGN